MLVKGTAGGCCNIGYPAKMTLTWWRHQMETFSALLAICAGNSPVAGEFPAQRPVTRSFDVFFDLCLNKRLSKQSWGWWFETLSRPLCRHCNELKSRELSFAHNVFFSFLIVLKFCAKHDSDADVFCTNFQLKIWFIATAQTISDQRWISGKHRSFVVSPVPVDALAPLWSFIYEQEEHLYSWLSLQFLVWQKRRISLGGFLFAKHNCWENITLISCPPTWQKSHRWLERQMIPLYEYANKLRGYQWLKLNGGGKWRITC